MSEIAEFRAESKAWLERNCPQGARGPGVVHSGSTKVQFSADLERWLERMAERGWTVPTWPKAYGGAELSAEQAQVLFEEMGAIEARLPLINMGTRMLGPTLLEYGTESQKQEHLTRIAEGKADWCQGYSEPGAGSDLASLRTRAELKGDHFVVNGQKIWTSGAQTADWMFALVRTDMDAPKHRGISFLLIPMDQDGVTVRPIALISGSSPFCETFLDNALASKADLIGEMNAGWGIGKRLLEHERSGQGGLGPATAQRRLPVGVTVDLDMVEIARKYLGTTDAKLADPALRQQVLDWVRSDHALQLAQKRAREMAGNAGDAGALTSIFKLRGSQLAQDRQALLMRLMGSQGLGWEGDAFTEQEVGVNRSWLASRAVTIYGGTDEVQANIIAKRVLGLPD